MEKPPWLVDEKLRGRLDLDTKEGQRVAAWSILIFLRQPGTTRLSAPKVRGILEKNGISFRPNIHSSFLRRMARFYGWKQDLDLDNRPYIVSSEAMAGERRWYLLDEEVRGGKTS